MGVQKPKPYEIGIYVSDIHCGSKVGLIDVEHEILIDGGSYYTPSIIQQKMWVMWQRFWNDWVPKATDGKPYAVVLNGDSVEGSPYNSIENISSNPADQVKYAVNVLKPIKERCNGHLYITRGTPAHVGISGYLEEMVGSGVGAIPNELGQFARFEIWMEIGKGLTHVTHHIGTTSATTYETTALTRELAELYTESGRWNLRPVDIAIRSHRHRYAKAELPSVNDQGCCITTPGWQAKTPFVHKIPGGRVSQPQFGGVMVRDNGEELYTRKKVWPLDRPNVIVERPLIEESS